jgi:hypothetical protein
VHDSREKFHLLGGVKLPRLETGCQAKTKWHNG